VAVAQQRQLLAQQAATAIATPVVVAEDHRQGKGQGRDPTRQPQITIAEVANEENGIGLEPIQQMLIGISP
tara:strand:- start:1114 stop:1326 length:213 start_codon:yes stop_codon:yes gene_type:complete